MVRSNLLLAEEAIEELLLYFKLDDDVETGMLLTDSQFVSLLLSSESERSESLVSDELLEESESLFDDEESLDESEEESLDESEEESLDDSDEIQ